MNLQAEDDLATAISSLLPVLIKHLKSVTTKTESASLELGQRLEQISQRAKAQSEEITYLLALRNDAAPDGDSSITELQNAVGRVNAQAGALVHDIAQIVMSMQFQDFTRQKIEYINEALLTIQARSQMGDPNTAGVRDVPAWPTKALDALERLDAGELVAVGSEENVTLF